MHAPYDQRGRGRDAQPYLAEVNHAVNRARFVNNVLNAQIAAGRNILVSPSLVHGRSGTVRELDMTIDYAKRSEASALVKGRTLLFSVEATEGIFADDESRAEMLDKLVELPERPIYLRMMTNGQPSRRGYANQDALAGLREVVQSLSDNDRPVFLPQASIAGWLMLPFGAKAFGAGISSSLQRCTAPEGGGGGGGRRPLPWYFAPSVLGFVLATELDALRKVSGWVECTCPICTASPPNAKNFDTEAAGKHFLWSCAELANDLNRARDPLVRVKNRLRDASRFWQTAQARKVVLDDRSQPTHLEAWTAVVG
jgi:hypothetical protein